MLAALAIILVVEPLVALAIVAALGHSTRTALTVALGLAQTLIHNPADAVRFQFPQVVVWQANPASMVGHYQLGCE